MFWGLLSKLFCMFSGAHNSKLNFIRLIQLQHINNRNLIMFTNNTCSHHLEFNLQVFFHFKGQLKMWTTLYSLKFFISNVKTLHQACLLPFNTSFVRLLTPCNCFLEGKLCGFQINFLKVKVNIHIIANILTCLTWWKHDPNQRATCTKWTDLTIELIVCAKLDILRPSSFT